jgi:hypothetical protein
VTFISLIPKFFSWGTLCITREGLQCILAHENVFTPYLDFVLAFGSKINDEQNRWDGFQGFASTPSQNGTAEERFGDDR